MKHCALAVMVLFLAGCSQESKNTAIFVTTIPPMRMIVEEIVGPENVVCIVPPGASPHAFELRPSHARQVQAAKLLVYVADNLDGWARELPASERLEVVALIETEDRLVEDEGHHAGEENPHFWSDPQLLDKLLPEILVALSNADSGSVDAYEVRFEAFRTSLAALDAEVEAMFAPLKGRSVIVMHPSWEYFFKRYGVEVVGVLEPAPGHEPSPRDIEKLIAVGKANGVRAVLSEPQLPLSAATVLAAAIGVEVVEIDPLGGVPGRDSYADLLRYNARIIVEALQ